MKHDHYIVISDFKFGKGEKDRKLELLCFNSAYSFQELMSKKPRSLILTSGTLSPLDVFEQEVGIPFKFKLLNSHVINPEQILINVLKSGSNPSLPFKSSIEEREKNSQI